MSYQVLARKYRPRNFDTLVGQEHVVRALTHALQQKRLHHAYLFTGTRGVGKTTLSRILAKSLNCIGPDGNGDITAQPCGVCEACVAIDAGRFVDYIEMDAASNRGVDEMAQLLEQAVYAPSNARFKVYMIDEVHMLTNHAFNSMLKTLEEPPEHVKFILATTDPQKIPVTVLSRCLQFNLKQMPPGHIVSHLDNILGQEGIEFEAPALRLLAQGAHGSMRDALSLTDQAIAYAAGKVTLDAVQGMLGALDQSYLIRVLDALAQQDGAGLLAVADEMAARSLSYNAALQDLGTILHQVALAQTVPAALSDDLPQREDIVRLAQQFDAGQVQLFYQIVVHGRNELGLAPDEYAGFSMTLLRMLAFRPLSAADGAAGGGGTAPGGTGKSAGPSARRPAGTASVAAGSDHGAAAASPAAAAASVSAPQVPAPAPAPVRAPVPTAHLSAAPQAAVASAPVSGDRGRAGNNNGAADTASLSPAMAALAAARAGSANRAAGVPQGPRAASASVSASATQAPAPVVGQVATATVTSAAAVAASVPAPAQRAANRVDAAYAEDLSSGPSSAPPPWEQDAPPWGDEMQASPASASIARPPALSKPAPLVQSTAAQAPSAPATTVAVPAAAAAVVIDPQVLQQTARVAAALGWDGAWPALAIALPLRGVAHQLSRHSQLLRCEDGSGNGVVFHLRIPYDNLCAAGSVDKLAAALTEQFGKNVRVEVEVGPVQHTADILAQAEQAAQLQDARERVEADPFLQALAREFGAKVAPESIRLA